MRTRKQWGMRLRRNSKFVPADTFGHASSGKCFILSTSENFIHTHLKYVCFCRKQDVSDHKVYMNTLFYLQFYFLTFLHLSSADCLRNTPLYLFQFIPITLTWVVRTMYWASVFQKGYNRSTINPHCWVPFPMSCFKTLTGKAQPCWAGWWWR